MKTAAITTTTRSTGAQGTKAVEIVPFTAQIGGKKYKLHINDCLKYQNQFTVTHTASGWAMAHFPKAEPKMSGRHNIASARAAVEKLVRTHGAERVTQVIDATPKIKA